MTMATSIPMDEIRGLVEERTRFEAWLRALDERRDSTPAHVFERVQLDYEARLRRVMDSLALHLQPLREASEHLEREHDETSRQLAARHDDLAEAELRMLVGEFAPEEGERRRQEAAQEIQRLEGDRDALSSQLGDVRDLLGRASPPPAAAEATAEASAEALAEALAEAPAGEAAGEAAERETVPSAADAPVPMTAVSDADGGRTVVGDVDGRTLAGDVGAERHFAPPIRHPGSPASPFGTAGGSAPVAPNGGFGDPRPNAPPRPAPAYVPEVGPLVTPTASFSAQSGPEASPQQRTLRCEECGEMNYPTEWYCERCGGELAAM